jgi:hypothetical protein
MLVRKIKNKEELGTCVDLYIKYNREDLIPSDRETAIKAIRRYVTNNAFMRVLEVDGVIMAWLLAIVTQKDFVKGQVMQQVYYGSDFKGSKAFKAVVMLHDALLEEAELRKIRYVLSTGSNQDENNTFTRILEKAGWARVGSLAVYDLA